jgi:hypothetical protein
VENVPERRSPDPRGHALPSDSTLIGLAAVGVAGVCVGGLFSLSGGELGLPCPLRTLTGLNCPFCGITRMASSVLQGDLAAALRFNAPVLIGGVVLLYLWLSWVLQRFGVVRLPRPRLPARAQRLLYPALVVLALLFMVLRNLPFAPFTALHV